MDNPWEGIMRNFVLLVLLTTLLSCGKDGSNGLNGVNGGDGKDGDSAVAEIVTIEDVDRSATPWASNNKITIDKDGFIILPDSFTIDSITNTENGGWFDFIVGDVVFCYQGKVGKRQYDFKYKKSAGATTGCDTNSDKDTGLVILYALIESGEDLQVIPRAPRYDAVEDFSFAFVGAE